MDRNQTIRRRIGAYAFRRDRIKRKINLIAVGRVVCFVAMIIGFAFSFDGDYTYPGAALLLAGTATFLFLMVIHDRCYRYQTRCEQLGDLLAADLARAEYRFSEVGYDNPISFPEDHPFAADLDLTGPSSLLAAIDNSFHKRAKERLHGWLEQIDSVAVISARQKAVAELTERKRFRLKLALAARHDSVVDLAPTDLDAWLKTAAPASLSLVPYLLGRLLSLVTLTLITLTFVFNVSGLPWFPVFLFQAFIFYVLDFFHRPFINPFMERGKAIAATCSAIQLFEQMQVTSPHLKALQETLQADKKGAGPHLSKLLNIHEMLSYRSSGFAHLVLNGLFLWDQHYLRKLDLWRTQHGARLPAWIALVFEVEALSALANYRWLFPGRPFPELRDDPNVHIQAKGMGHPSIADEKRVCNDYLMPQTGDLHLITGSNMSGKSTFLRTIGLNMLLARMGAPVCADSLSCSLPRLMTSICIVDSLADGYSYFYAEVRRIKQILDAVAADQGPIFYLLDEILKGTNSRERLIATKTMVDFLLKHQTSGLITTHDLELLSVQEANPDTITNYHFQESVREGELDFDYKLKSGELTSTNALRLMRLAGVPLDL